MSVLAYRFFLDARSEGAGWVGAIGAGRGAGGKNGRRSRGEAVGEVHYLSVRIICSGVNRQ